MKNAIYVILVLAASLLSQFEWSEPVILAPKIAWPDAYGYTEIIVDNNGIIHAFWEKAFDRTGDNYANIFYSYSTDGGVNWSGTENLTPQYTNYGQNIGNLNVVCDSKNNLHLMFLRGAEWSKVMHMKFDGTSWTVPVSIYDYAVNYLYVTIDANDRIYAVWWSDPSYYSYFEDGIWSTPESISSTYLPSIRDIIVDKNDNILACGSRDIGYYVPFICKFDKTAEQWTDFEQIEGYNERSIASALTLSKNDTINVNISVGPTWDENVNYNLKRKIGETSWSLPQYINENTDMLNKDFVSDNDGKLHLFERNSVDHSLIHTEFKNGICTEYTIQSEANNYFWKQNIFFDNQDEFYVTYTKVYSATNEREVLFQRKQIEVRIEDNDELTIKDCTLYQNYPNPFNSNTVIEYSLNKPSNVKLSVYNLKGELINNLLNKKQNTGKYSVQFKADDLGSGVYYYRLEVDGIVKDTKKMLYLR